MKKLESTETYWIADTASVMGDVTLGKDVSVWYGAVIRGDMGSITIGEGTNIQDNAVVHENTCIGKNCTIGHSAIVHACTIGDNTIVGMGAIVLDDAVIGKNCIVGAGALVTGRTVVPDNTLIIGSPAKTMKPLSEESIKGNLASAEEYKELMMKHR